MTTYFQRMCVCCVLGLLLAGTGCTTIRFPYLPPDPPVPPVKPPVSALRNGYVVNYSGQVLSYSVSPTGLWNQIPGPLVQAGTTPSALAVDVTGRFLYVLNFEDVFPNRDSSISEFLIDPVTGAVQPGTAKVMMQGRYGPQALVLDPTGKFLYATDSMTGGAAAYRIDATTGLLTPNSPAVYPAPVIYNNTQYFGSFVLDPSGRFLYANSGSYFASFMLDRTSGALTSTGGLYTGGGGRGFIPVVDPAGKFLYAVDEGSNTVNAYAIDAVTGALSIPPSNFSTKVGDGPSAVAIDATGQFVYVENRSAGTLSQFRTNGDGSLTPLNPATIQQGGYELLADPSGQLLYVGSNPLDIYRTNADGTLASYSYAPTGQQALAFAVRSR